VCGRAACTVRRAGRVKALPDPYHSKMTNSWIPPLVNSKDEVDFAMLFPLRLLQRWGKLSDSEISNIKHQIPNKSQIPISNDPNMFGILNFGHAQRRRLRRVLGFVCDLEYSTEIEAFFV
jgi:hypothetical protein